MSILGSLAGIISQPQRRRFSLGLAGLAVLCGSLALFWLLERERPLPFAIDAPGEGLAADPEIAAAVEEARGAVLREPRSASAWGRLGKVLHANNLSAPAETCYARAEGLEPNNPDWPYLRGVIRQRGKEPEEVVPLFRRAADLGEVDRLAQLRLCETLLDLGRLEEAAAALHQELAVIPKSPRVHLGLARLALARQNWKGALQDLELVGESPAARKKVHSLRVVAHQQLGDESAAKREQIALAGLPEDVPWPDAVVDPIGGFRAGMTVRLERAHALLESGDTPSALSLLTRTVCDYPEQAAPWAALGLSLAHAGDFPVAEVFLRKAVELYPGRADVWSSLGQARLQQKDYAGALESFRVVIGQKPTDAEAHFHAGECLEAVGDEAAARQEYEQAIRWKPDYHEARDRLAKLSAKPK